MITNLYFKSKKSFVPFVPTDIAGCQLWLKADAGITKDGSNYVSAWADQSGNGNDAVQGTGSAQPLWVDNEINGKPSVYCQLMKYFYQPPIVLNDFTVFLVHKWESLRGYVGYVLRGSYDGKNAGFFTNTPNVYGGSYGIFDGVNELSSNDAHISNAYSLFEYNNSILYRNSLESTSYLYNQPITTQMTIDFIGCLQWGAVGFVSEIIIYDSILSDTDRQLVESYINTKYALW